MPIYRRLFGLTLAVAVGLIAPLAQAAVPDDPQHQMLAELAGHWDVHQQLWMSQGKPPQVDEGTAELTTVLGHHLQQRLTIPGKSPFEGLGYLGFDSATGSYFTSWMDVNFPGLIVARGEADTSGKLITLRGTMSDSADPQTPVPVRELVHLIDRNHFSYEYFETRDGKESLTVRLAYTRRM